MNARAFSRTSKRDLSNSPEELRLLYQISVADITNAKKEQFDITNYTLALQAAVFFLSQSTKLSVLPADTKLIALLAFVICSAAFTLVALSNIRTLQSNIARFRGRILRLRATLTPAFKRAFGPEEEPTYQTIRYRSSVYLTMLWLLRVVLLAMPLLITLNMYL